MTVDEQKPPGEEPDDIGSVGEEAAKLFGALSDWARDEGTGRATGLGGLAAHAAEAVREVDQHLATGAAECTYCPVCRTVHVVRGASPEVKAHLVSAASSFLQAASAMLATHVPADASARSDRVERIDLDGDAEDQPDERPHQHPDDPDRPTHEGEAP